VAALLSSFRPGGRKTRLSLQCDRPVFEQRARLDACILRQAGFRGFRGFRAFAAFAASRCSRLARRRRTGRDAFDVTNLSTRTNRTRHRACI
jgi:hypothetical protein